MVPNLGSPDVLGLQLTEILASTASGEGFKASGSFSPRTSGDPRMGTTAVH